MGIIKVERTRSGGRHVSVDLRKPAQAVGKLVPRPVRAAADRINRIAEHPVVDALDVFGVTPASGRRERPRDGVVVGCSVPCAGTVTGLADLPGVDGQYSITTLFLFRLAVERPDGPVEACVRQDAPRAVLATIGPGARLPLLAHPTDRSRVVVAWPDPDSVLWETRLFRFPAPDEWPAPGRIEVRDHPRHARRLADRRATWTSRWAQVERVGGVDRLYEGRTTHAIDLVFEDGSRARAQERVPALALERLAPGAWAPALTDGRKACIDWQAFVDRTVPPA